MSDPGDEMFDHDDYPEDFGDDHIPDLGPCCGCGTTKGVVSTVMLDRRSPISGRGWGCAVCKLPFDGATAVLCGQCLGLPPRFACRGNPATDGRIPVEGFRNEPFGHNEAMHRGEAA
jgi:hypothetical protein